MVVDTSDDFGTDVYRHGALFKPGQADDVAIVGTKDGNGTAAEGAGYTLEMALQAGKTEDAAQAAYRSAGDDEKADALFRLLEAKAAVRKPRELFRRINAEFQTTQQAYLARLVTE